MSEMHGSKEHLQTVIHRIYDKKFSTTKATIAFLAGFLLVYSLLFFLGITDIEVGLIGFMLILIGAIILRQVILSYQIKRRLYGESKEEAREIIREILGQSSTM